MIALDAALRRLTVCQQTRESRGNGGGLRPRVWLRLRAAAGGNWTPDEISQLEGEANFSLSWGMKPTQKLLCMGLFSKKLSGPLLRPRCCYRTVGHTHRHWLARRRADRWRQR